MDFKTEKCTEEFWDSYEEFVEAADEYRAVHGETGMPPYMADQLGVIRDVLLQLDASNRAYDEGDYESFDNVDDALDYIFDEEE